MKAKVLKKFRDRREGVMRHKGDVFECTKERFAEICQTNKSLVEAAEEQEAQSNKKPEVAPVQPEEEIEKAEDMKSEGEPEKAEDMQAEEEPKTQKRSGSRKK